MRLTKMSRAWRILRADGRLLEPNIECDRKATREAGTKALDFLDRQDGDVGQLFGCGVFVDEGVRNEQVVVVQDQGVQGSQAVGFGRTPITSRTWSRWKS